MELLDIGLLNRISDIGQVLPFSRFHEKLVERMFIAIFLFEQIYFSLVFTRHLRFDLYCILGEILLYCILEEIYCNKVV